MDRYSQLPSAARLELTKTVILGLVRSKGNSKLLFQQDEPGAQNESKLKVPVSHLCPGFWLMPPGSLSLGTLVSFSVSASGQF